MIASASPEDDCWLYQLANFKKSGQLIEAFNTGGSKEVPVPYAITILYAAILLITNFNDVFMFFINLTSIYLFCTLCSVYRTDNIIKIWYLYL